MVDVVEAQKRTEPTVWQLKEIPYNVRQSKDPFEGCPEARGRYQEPVRRGEKLPEAYQKGLRAVNAQACQMAAIDEETPVLRVN